MARSIRLLIGTRKGAWIWRGNSGCADWVIEGPIHLGQIVSHLVVDRRTGGTMLMAAATGHLGPTIFRSTDGGASWVEAKRPPAFEKTTDPAVARAVDHAFWLENGHAGEPGVWWAGTSPPGLFVSEDDGVSWESVTGFNDHPMYRECGGHSIRASRPIFCPIPTPNSARTPTSSPLLHRCPIVSGSRTTAASIASIDRR
jgi:hypothetical protein